jgi:hypothetical protein
MKPRVVKQRSTRVPRRLPWIDPDLMSGQPECFLDMEGCTLYSIRIFRKWARQLEAWRRAGAPPIWRYLDRSEAHAKAIPWCRGMVGLTGRRYFSALSAHC